MPFALPRPTWLTALGARVQGDRLRRVLQSGHYINGTFRNPTTTHKPQPQDAGKIVRLWFQRGTVRVPAWPVPIRQLSSRDYAIAPPSGLRATWMGHASSLLEIDGHRILIDPMWSARCSPFVHIGPRRFYPPPIALADLPALDAVVLSHDHYDHLDFATVQRLAHTGVRFVTSLGVGAHLDAWGVAAERITELDWEETTEVAGLQITALPARHFSGRRFRDTNTTLWSSWSIAGRTHRVFYSGDSGYFDGFRDIGIRYGPFDLTLMAIGAYGPTWPDVHMTPEEAVHAHRDVRGHVLMPVHWGTFNLAFHGWQEPADRLLATAQGTDLVLVMPRPGERVEPTTPSPVERWWAHAPV